MDVWGPKGIVMGHGSWKFEKGCGTNLPNLYQTTSFKLIALHHSSCLRVCFLLILMVVSVSIKLRPRSLPIKATLQTPTSGLAVSFAATTLHHLAQWYCGEAQLYYLSVASLPACCVVESGEPTLVRSLAVCGLCEQVWGCICREKMRDRSHSQRSVPEWCCSAPSSTLSTPNEKFLTSSEVTLESGNVFPPLLCPFLDNNFKS